VAAARRADRRRVHVEDAVVVRLAVLAEDLTDHRVGLVAVGLQRLLDHPVATVGHDRALEGSVRLQPDDELVGLVDVAGGVRGDGRRGVRVDVVDALLTLGREHRRQAVPDPGGAGGGAGEERAVPLVRRVVALDEVAHVDVVRPRA